MDFNLVVENYTGIKKKKKKFSETQTDMENPAM